LGASVLERQLEDAKPTHTVTWSASVEFQAESPDFPPAPASDALPTTPVTSFDPEPLNVPDLAGAGPVMPPNGAQALSEPSPGSDTAIPGDDDLGQPSSQDGLQAAPVSPSDAAPASPTEAVSVDGSDE
jgi:hypothetical protein